MNLMIGHVNKQVWLRWSSLTRAVDGFSNSAKHPLFYFILITFFFFGVRVEALSHAEFEYLLIPQRGNINQAVKEQAVEILSNELEKLSSKEPMWPIYKFILAEVLFKRGDHAKATQHYREIIEHAANDPYSDTWGGNALITFSLIRWLALQEGKKDPKSFQQLAARADKLLQTRLVRSVFKKHPALPKLPLFEEELYLTLAKVAMEQGLSKKAAQYFLNYLSRMRSDKHISEENSLYKLVVKHEISTPDRIALFRGRRLYSLGLKEVALPFLEQASESKDESVRWEGLFLLARSSKSMDRVERVQVYKSVAKFAPSEALAEEALYQSALLFGSDDAQLKDTLDRLIKEYPDGNRTDDALFWLARSAQLRGNLDSALDWYQHLRKLEVDNLNSRRASIYPALALIWRGGKQDFEAAKDLLTTFVGKYPESTYLPMVNFWLGRIAEEQDESVEVKNFFTKCVELDQYGYYGLRARLHLADGTLARSQILIENEKIRDEIRSAYTTGITVGDSLNENSIYSQRIISSLNSGLYKVALAGEDALRLVDDSKRLEKYTFNDLDATGLATQLAVMIALREDALAAADLAGTMTARISIAQVVGEKAGDWPMVMALVHPVHQKSTISRSELMATLGFLRTAYPVVFEELFRSAIEQYPVSPAVLYATMRNESSFYPAALSYAGALGLFQFMPNTFGDLDKKWKLLKNSEATNRSSFLMNKKLSIDLGARWFAEKKLPAFDQNPIFAIIAHHSGNGRVRKWKKIWDEHGWENDFEMMIETFRRADFDPKEKDRWGAAARSFARWTWTDLALIDAIKLYQ